MSHLLHHTGDRSSHQRATALRLSFTLLVASAVTWALLGFMQTLVATGKKAITKPTQSHIVDFVRVPRPETVERKERKPERPPAPSTPPPAAPEPKFDALDPNAGVIAVMAAVPAEALALTGVRIGTSAGFSSTDGDYLPIVKVAPMYPRRAAAAGVEGWVLLEFTVTRLGTVKDVRVVESSHTMFERAAIGAALKFKYKPRVIDGEAVEVTGVLNKITFILEEDDSVSRYRR